MTAADFLFELGVEELPIQETKTLPLALANLICQNLQKQNLAYSDIQTFGTPRRITVLIKQLQLQQAETKINRRGPAVATAYDKNGNPTPAALGFAKSCGVNLDELSTLETEKGSWLSFDAINPGQATEALLPEILNSALNKLPIKKRMRWAAQQTPFVRPVHWVLALLGKKVLNVTCFEKTAGNITYGHRFHHPQAVTITAAHEYEAKLEQANVIVCFEKRKALISEQISTLMQQHKAKVVENNDLLDVVTALTEYPTTLLANFSKNFLKIPQECLISSMEEHQKSFAVTDNNGKLLPFFLLVSNIVPDGSNKILDGNEKVMHARLADAKFHYETDVKQPLAARIEQLKSITFQKQLGSIYDKTARINDIALYLEKTLYGTTESKVYITKATELCKADLVTNMVYEFPELQGIIGNYYSQNDKEPPEVSTAIEEHYLPRFADDVLPQSKVGICLAIADRIDSLVGLFGIGKQPTGEKDPYSLRRQTLAIIRILVEQQLSINLEELIAESVKAYGSLLNNAPSKELGNFFKERLRNWCVQQGLPIQLFLATQKYYTNPLDMYNRILALHNFQQNNPEKTEILAAMNKRTKNILLKNPSDKRNIDKNLLSLKQEQELNNLLEKSLEVLKKDVKERNYESALDCLTLMNNAVTDFFDKVMVTEPKFRENRLAILKQLAALCSTVADLSELSIEKNASNEKNKKTVNS